MRLQGVAHRPAAGLLLNGLPLNNTSSAAWRRSLVRWLLPLWACRFSLFWGIRSRLTTGCACCATCLGPLQLFTRSAAQQLYSNQRLQRWCFDVELVYLAQQLKVAGWMAGWVAGRGKRCRAHASIADLHFHCIAACPPPHLQVPMAEVQVTWTEIPGSKIRLASMAHMALELAMIKAGYSMGEGDGEGVHGGRAGGQEIRASKR